MGRIKVLIVDDDESSRDILSIVVSESMGHVALTATNGMEALELIKSEDPDIVITDLMMAQMSGVELISKIKSLGGTQEIILVSAHSDIEAYLQAMDLGAYEAINKPFHPSEISRTINKIIESRGIKK